MRHLHFVQALDPLLGGGLGTASLELHLSMIESGVRSSLVTTQETSEKSPYPGVTALRRRGITAAFYAPDLSGETSRLLPQSDIVHGHGLYVYPNWAVGRRAISSNRLLVYHPHGMLEPWALSNSRFRKRVVRTLFENRNIRNAGLWRALTPREADQIRALGVTNPIVVAPNGVGREVLDVQRRSTDNDRTSPARLLFLGRIHAKKGLDILIPAWASLGSARRGWELVIAGPDEGGHGSEIAAAIRQHDLERNVEVIGEVRGEAKYDLLRSCDAFVLPSYSEGFPVTVLEAMASKLPVVVTRTSNVAAVEDHGAGFECEATLTSLATSLRHLTALTAVERHAMGTNGRTWVERDFAWSAIADIIVRFSEDLAISMR